MSAEPLQESEILLRRFQAQDYDRTDRVPALGAFLPNKSDTDGLSLFRERCLSAEKLLANARSQSVRETGGVAAVPVSLLIGLGLTLEPDLADPDGHVTVKELNRADYDSSEEKQDAMKLLADRLIRLARAGDFVRIHAKPKGA
ncbi:MAG: hypothetical protein K2W96_07175 [Gemmataceae bacterium]|nr:hypothetical protein [Gemmataceae bacterium]